MTTNNNFSPEHHMQDERWTAVDAYTFPHSHPASRPNSEALSRTLVASKEAGLPDISLSPAQGKLLSLWAKAAGVRRALEVGTLGGYSALWLTSQNPDLSLTTVEFDPHHASVARANLEAAGVSGRVELLEGAGIDVLPRLRDEVRAGTREPYGLVFIDADKPNNLNYFNLALDMVGPRAVICVDNVVRKGGLADPTSKDPRILASRELVEAVGKNPRVDSVVVQTVDEKGYDGALWAVVN